MQAVTLGVDIGKRWFHVIGLNSSGRVVLREKLTRVQLLHKFATHPICVVAMETCCGSQHLGRIAASYRHDIRLIPAQHVRPFVKSQKNDFNDATALAEVARLPNMRAVPLRSIEQIDVQSMHRARQRLLEQPRIVSASYLSTGDPGGCRERADCSIPRAAEHVSADVAADGSSH